MIKKSKIYSCENGHKILSDIKNEKRLTSGKVVCGTCGKNFIPFSSPKWSGEKHFLCQRGHVITINPFGNNQCNFSWGNGSNEFVNMEYSPEELTDLLKAGEVMCPGGTSTCDEVLTPLEDCALIVPQLMGIKTKTRVGDIWDKNKYPEPKIGSYDKEYNFHDTEFAKRSRQRINKLREKRNTRPAGRIITKPTDRRYKDNSGPPSKKDL